MAQLTPSGASLQSAPAAFIHTDHIQTPQVATDSQGKVVWQGQAEAFGRTQTQGNLPMPWRFPGQYADAETNLHYNGFRTYNPQIGRYLERDPLGLAAGVNVYGYVDQNPVMGRDPWGLKVIISPELQNIFENIKKSKRAKGQLDELEKEIKTISFVLGHEGESYTDTGFLNTKVVIDADQINNFNYITSDGNECALSYEQVFAHELYHAYVGKTAFATGGVEANERAAIRNENKIMFELDKNHQPRLEDHKSLKRK